MPTSTPQNNRLFAPQVVLSQETSRLIIKLKSGEGYTIPSGITLGDVIRYDPASAGYTLSKANTDVNAEVVGVVESYSGGEYTVVTYGSMRYPTSRLTLITTSGGGGGGVDVLFLSPTTAGGLTGTIDLSDGTEKIVKPVLQVAPSGSYNGIVLNYVGYKTGNQAVIQEDSAVLPVGSIMYALPTITPGANWIRIDSGANLRVSDYPELYSIYGKSFGYLERVVVQEALTFNYTQATQTINGTTFILLFAEQPDLTTNSVLLMRGPNTPQISLTNDFYVSANGQNPVRVTPLSTTIETFRVPAVTAGSVPDQDGTSLVPYLKAYEIVSVKIPETITLSGLTLSGNAAISGTVQLGSISNLETFVTTLKTRIDNALIP